MSYDGFVSDIAARYPTSDVRFAVEVYGLPYVFTSSEFNSSAFTSLFGANRSQLKVLIGDSVRVGQYRLNAEQRRVTSATASFSIVADTAGIVHSLITPRVAPIARLKENLTTSETAADVTRTTYSVSDTPIYVGSETMRATAWSANVVTVARAQYGTEAQEHFGDTTGVGANVYPSPQSWSHRRVTIWAYLVDGNNYSPASSAYFGGVYRGRLRGVPAFDSGEYSFSVEHDSERIASTECGLGLREITVQPELQDASDTFLHLSDLDLALFGAVSSEYSILLAEGEDETLPLTITSVGADYVEHGRPDLAAQDVIGINLGGYRVRYAAAAKTVKHACRLKGDPAEVALKLLVSNLGNQAVYNADVLPGTTRTVYGGPQFRFGAGLGEDVIDQGVFEALMGRAPVPWDVLIDRPIKVGQILQELCAALGLFWYLDDEGLIAFSAMSDRDYASTASLAITKEMTIVDSLPSVFTEQGPALSSVMFRGSWDALIGKHLATVESVDWEIKNQFGEDADSVAVDANMTSVNVSAIIPESQLRGALRRNGGADIGTVEALTRRIQRESTLSRQYVDVPLPLKFLSVKIGDIVTYTDDRLPDGEGGTINAAQCRCVGFEPSFTDGIVILQLMITRPGWRYAPSALITANSGGSTPTLTLSTSWDGESSPGLNFPAGCVVFVFNCTTGTFDVKTVQSSTATSVSFNSAFSSFTYTASVSFVFYQSTGTVPGGYDENDFAVMCENDANPGDTDYSEWG